MEVMVDEPVKRNRLSKRGSVHLERNVDMAGRVAGSVADIGFVYCRLWRELLGHHDEARCRFSGKRDSELAYH